MFCTSMAPISRPVANTLRGERADCAQLTSLCTSSSYTHSTDTVPLQSTSLCTSSSYTHSTDTVPLQSTSLCTSSSYTHTHTHSPTTVNQPLYQLLLHTHTQSHYSRPASVPAPPTQTVPLQSTSLCTSSSYTDTVPLQSTSLCTNSSYTHSTDTVPLQSTSLCTSSSYTHTQTQSHYSQPASVPAPPTHTHSPTTVDQPLYQLLLHTQHSPTTVDQPLYQLLLHRHTVPLQSTSLCTNSSYTHSTVSLQSTSLCTSSSYTHSTVSLQSTSLCTSSSYTDTQSHYSRPASVPAPPTHTAQSYGLPSLHSTPVCLLWGCTHPLARFVNSKGSAPKLQPRSINFSIDHIPPNKRTARLTNYLAPTRYMMPPGD